MDRAKRLYHWLFTKEEREPMGFISTFFLIIVISTAIGVLVIPLISNLM